MESLQDVTRYLVSASAPDVECGSDIFPKSTSGAAFQHRHSEAALSVLLASRCIFTTATRAVISVRPSFAHPLSRVAPAPRASLHRRPAVHIASRCALVSHLNLILASRTLRFPFPSQVLRRTMSSKGSVDTNPYDVTMYIPCRTYLFVAGRMFT